MERCPCVWQISCFWDISNVIYDLIKDTANCSRCLSVCSVNKFLDDLASCEESVDQIRVLRQLIVSMDATELKYLVRIILKNMKFGYGYNQVLNRIHPDAVAQYETHADLRRLCSEIKDLTVRLTPEVRFNDSLLPMLAKRPDRDLKKRARILKDDDFVFEPKLDGELAVVHWDREKSFVRVFSRNGVDLGNSFHYNVPILEMLTYSIKNCSRVILDGEILGYDSSVGEYTLFEENRSILKEMMRFSSSL